MAGSWSQGGGRPWQRGQRAIKAWATRPGPRDPAKTKPSWSAAARRPEQEGSAAGGVRATPWERRSHHIQKRGRGPARSCLAQGPCQQSGTSYQRASEMTLRATSRIKPSHVRAHAALANPPSWTRLRAPALSIASNSGFFLTPNFPLASFHRPLQHLLTQQLLPVQRPVLGGAGPQRVGSCDQSNLCSNPWTPPHKRLPSVGGTVRNTTCCSFKMTSLDLKNTAGPVTPTQGTAFSGSSLTVLLNANPAPGFLPGESHGQRSLARHGPWGHRESDTTEATYAHSHT